MLGPFKKMSSQGSWKGEMEEIIRGPFRSLCQRQILSALIMFLKGFK